MKTTRAELARLNLKARLVKVSLENIGVRIRPVNVKVKNQGVRMRRVKIMLRNEGLKMRGVAVRVNKVKISLCDPPTTCFEEEEIEELKDLEEEEGEVEDLNDITTEVSVGKGIPLWARTRNYMEEVRIQLDAGPAILSSIFAPVDLDHLRLEEQDIFRLPSKTGTRPRIFSLGLDLSG